MFFSSTPPVVDLTGLSGMKNGIYTSNGVLDREVDIGVDLASKTHVYIIIKAATTEKSVHRIEYEQGISSMSFDNTADSTHWIKTLTANGFTIGDFDEVNKDTYAYRYIVFWVD